MAMRLKKIIKDKRGFAMITFLVMFALVFPLSMLIPDMILWGAGWVKAQTIVNETAQFLGELGGADLNTIQYLKDRFEAAGLDPADWDLILTPGPLPKGQQGGIAVSTEYYFTSVRAFGLNFSVPVSASATYTSEVWIR